MNKLLLLVFFSSMLCLEAVQWQTLEEGLSIAKQSNKLVLLDVVRDNCHYCTDMDENVFNDAKMTKWIESCFVPVKLNLSHDTLPMGIKVQVTPTFIFLSSDKKVLKRIQGSWNKQDFKELSKKLCRKY